MDKGLAEMLNRAYSQMLDNLKSSPDRCKPDHRRYNHADLEHPGWILVGCHDCNIHFSVAEEQAKAWEEAAAAHDSRRQ